MSKITANMIKRPIKCSANILCKNEEWFINNTRKELFKPLAIKLCYYGWKLGDIELFKKMLALAYIYMIKLKIKMSSFELFSSTFLNCLYLSDVWLSDVTYDYKDFKNIFRCKYGYSFTNIPQLILKDLDYRLHEPQTFSSIYEFLYNEKLQL